MKKAITTLLLLLGLTAISEAQYRAINISSTNGMGLNEVSSFHSGSVGVHYDINSGWYFYSWNGLSYDRTSKYNRWVSTQSTINKYLGRNFSVGTGIQYNHSFETKEKDTYVILTIRKVIKL